MPKKQRTDETIDKIRNIFPGHDVLLKSGESIFVQPIPVSYLPRYAGAIAKLVKRLREVDFDIISSDDLSSIITVATQEVLNLLCAVFKKEKEWLDTVTINDCLKLWNALMEENELDEIVKNVGSLVEAMNLGSTLE